MKVDEAYNKWADTYDNEENKTRDLEKVAVKSILESYDYQRVIELGCGTGKNTQWLNDTSDSLIALDFSEEMLRVARTKVSSDNVQFRFADINKNWEIEDGYADLISCSLTLEHILNLDFIFKEASKKLQKGGIFYICELHPFKQYMGSKANFESNEGIIVPEVFTHNISEYLDSASNNGFSLSEFKEWFDSNNKTEIPRLISFVFKK